MEVKSDDPFVALHGWWLENETTSLARARATKRRVSKLKYMKARIIKVIETRKVIK